jgi:4-aminobutyrate aminotransferase/(S)-3-amino-2-methylpropionate transaminase
VLAFRGAYHGLSHGPLAACGLSDAFREPFAEQLGQHVTFARYGDGDAAARALRGGGIGAVLVEPILGRGGCVVPDEGFLPALRAACDGAGALLVADEIWTGLGRSGEMLASTAQTVPDVICVGKALGSGFPVSACIGRGAAMAAWGAKGGTAIHTATHFGAPIACAAALATLAEIESRRLPRRAVDVGARWQDAIAVRTDGRGVREVRGRGLMVGVELEGGEARALAASRALLERGFIVLTGGEMGDVLTLTPPLDVEEPLLSAFAAALGDVLGAS